MADDKLAEELGIVPMPQTINVPAKRHDVDSDEQFSEVQANIRNAADVGEIALQELAQIASSSQHPRAYEVRNAADVGEIALQELAQIASSSQHPRAYEVVSTLMGQIVNANKQLLEIEKLKLEIEKEKNGGQVEEAKVVNNNLFVGSTAELLEQLKSKKE
jgi:hypothetical protein